MKTTIDTEQLKANIDLIELAGRYTELRRVTIKEWHGPCPWCGGDDRFRVTADYFACRQCGRSGDAIEFVMQREGVGFKDAASILKGDTPMSTGKKIRPAHKPTGAVYEWDEAKHLAQLKRDQTALAVATDGQEYLIGRGITGETWGSFGLGYCPKMSLPSTRMDDNGEYSYPQQPAITMPWYHDGRLVAVRYRFLKPHIYTDKYGKKRLGQKNKGVKSKGYGPTSGHMFGMQVISPSCDQSDRTLVICEGEINAMSIWQVAHTTALDVLSLGSDTQKLAPWVIEYAERYGTVICWADRTEVAQKLQKVIRGSFAVSSEICGGQDANDLLKAGQLGGHISAWRYKIARATNSVERFVQCMAGSEDLDVGSRQVLDIAMVKFGRGGA